MKCATTTVAAMCAMTAAAFASGAMNARAATVIEPDDYADGAALTSIAPGIMLNTTASDGVIIPLFTVTAEESVGYASTGVNVFGHVGIDFWWQERRLRADFATPVQSVSIDAIGGTFFSRDVGVLEAYNAAGTLLVTYTSMPLPVGTSETMSIFRATPDISYISAYAVDGPEGFGPFTSLDHLVVNAVPEPAGLALAGLAGVSLCRRRTR